MSVKYISQMRAGYLSGGAWKRLYGLSVSVKDREEKEPLEPDGYRAPADVLAGRGWSEITLSGKACAREVKDLLQGASRGSQSPLTVSVWYNGYLYANAALTGWGVSQKNGEPEWEFKLMGAKGVRQAEPQWSALAERPPVFRGRKKQDGTGGTSVKRGSPLADVPDWYSFSLDVEGLSKNGYYGYAWSPSFTGCPRMEARFTLNWDADPDNVDASLSAGAQAWQIANSTGDASFTIGFLAACLESKGYGDEQGLVKSYTGVFEVLEDTDRIISVSVDDGESE